MIPKLSPTQADLERRLFREFEDLLIGQGFTYLSIPSTVQVQTVMDQFTGVWCPPYLSTSDGEVLSGSAEQGILEYFAGKEVEAGRYFAYNQCWRGEASYEGLLRVKEFRKLEQYVFCTPDTWEEEFSLVLSNATNFLTQHGIEWRVVDCTNDPGYHVFKKDVEVHTETYGWIETHSCTYFGDEQVKRHDIRGDVHTISNTGLASPRILIPLLEKMKHDTR